MELSLTYLFMSRNYEEKKSLCIFFFKFMHWGRYITYIKVLARHKYKGGFASLEQIQSLQQVFYNQRLNAHR